MIARAARPAAWLVLAGVLLAVSVPETLAATRLARLDEVVGEVLVTQRERFVRALPGMLVQPGERVITLSAAAVEIRYESLQRGRNDDAPVCRLSLGENSMVAIVDGDDCVHAIVSAEDERLARPAKPPVPSVGPDWPAEEPLLRCTLRTCLEAAGLSKL